ncbi:MAG TPA: RluA family pseudouridine synthase [Candidatus Limosilactobacillus faecipullorum]|nr:RluA family pseudouridine synthase [Candidatus Limosilactobacillus faecipullorum]
MRFTWTYQGTVPRKLRRVLKSLGVTSSLIKVAIFHGGRLLLNGETAWAIANVQPGDEVGIEVPDEQANDRVTPCDLPFEIAYEDQDFLVVNKAAGVATVPAHNVPVQDSLVNRVKAYYQRQGYPNQVTHVATRLDRDTSGLVIFPKHRFAHAVLDRQLKAHQIKKEYLAVVRGEVASHGYLDAPIQRDPESFVKRMIGPEGKVSVTEYWRQTMTSTASLIKIRLHTGRTHQIRCHFSWRGNPLFGDEMYGGDCTPIARQALHCQQISFFSPFLNQTITLKAALPEDMESLIENLGLK